MIIILIIIMLFYSSAFLFLFKWIKWLLNGLRIHNYILWFNYVSFIVQYTATGGCHESLNMEGNHKRDAGKYVHTTFFKYNIN